MDDKLVREYEKLTKAVAAARESRAATEARLEEAKARAQAVAAKARELGFTSMGQLVAEQGRLEEELTKLLEKGEMLTREF